MNTQIIYLYRDMLNNKKTQEVILLGQITPEEIEPYLDEGKYFIPSQVGLEDLQEWFKDGPNPSLDHPWHEVIVIDLTIAEPTIEVTALELLKNFQEGTWDENLPWNT